MLSTLLQAEEEARRLAEQAERLALAHQATPVGSIQHLLKQVGTSLLPCAVCVHAFLPVYVCRLRMPVVRASTCAAAAQRGILLAGAAPAAGV